MQRAYDYLKGHTYFIATVDGDQARVRPFGSLALLGGKLYVATVEGKRVTEQLRTSPKIELAAMGDNGWIRITAVAVEEKDPQVRAELWREAAARRGKDPEKPEDSSVSFALTDGTVTITRYNADPETFTF